MQTSSKTKYYKVMIDGRNFIMGNNREAKGFIAPRIIKAFSPEEAIQLAMETIFNDETLQNAVKNTSSNSPSLFLDAIEEIKMNQEEFVKAQKDINQKYLFYNEE